MDAHSPITVCLLGFTLPSKCGVLGLMPSVRSQTALTPELRFWSGIGLKFFLFFLPFFLQPCHSSNIYPYLSLKPTKIPPNLVQTRTHNSANVLCFSIKSIPEWPSKPIPSFSSEEARMLHCT